MQLFYVISMYAWGWRDDISRAICLKCPWVVLFLTVLLQPFQTLVDALYFLSSIVGPALVGERESDRESVCVHVCPFWFVLSYSFF